MISVIKVFLIICILLIISLNTYAEDLLNFNPDAIVVKALSHEPKDTGSLAELVDKNEIKISGENISINDLFKNLGIHPKKTKSIEAYAIMSWSIKRIRVSQKYEFLIQLGLSDDEDEMVTHVSVIPYRDRLLRYNLLNQENWRSIIFK
jgi:hypothetical protein